MAQHCPRRSRCVHCVAPACRLVRAEARCVGGRLRRFVARGGVPRRVQRRDGARHSQRAAGVHNPRAGSALATGDGVVRGARGAIVSVCSFSLRVCKTWLSLLPASESPCMHAHCSLCCVSKSRRALPPSQACLRDERWAALQQLTAHINEALWYLSNLRDKRVLAIQRDYDAAMTRVTVRAGGAACRRCDSPRVTVSRAESSSRACRCVGAGSVLRPRRGLQLPRVPPQDSRPGPRDQGDSWPARAAPQRRRRLCQGAQGRAAGLQQARAMSRTGNRFLLRYTASAQGYVRDKWLGSSTPTRSVCLRRVSYCSDRCRRVPFRCI
jgi:hypothetical protein